MREEWGPWIEHDGKGCPCVGEYAHLIFDRKIIRMCAPGMIKVSDNAVMGIVDGDGPEWGEFSFLPTCKVLRYRIRRPRGLTILQDLIENLPAPVRETEDA